MNRFEFFKTIGSVFLGFPLLKVVEKAGEVKEENDGFYLVKYNGDVEYHPGGYKEYCMFMELRRHKLDDPQA